MQHTLHTLEFLNPAPEITGYVMKSVSGQTLSKTVLHSCLNGQFLSCDVFVDLVPPTAQGADCTLLYYQAHYWALAGPLSLFCDFLTGVRPTTNYLVFFLVVVVFSIFFVVL